MKKVLLIAAIAVFGFTSVQAQEGGIKLGINVGLPVGDAGDVSSFGAALDFAYLFTVADSFQVGPATGYSHYFGKTETFMGVDIEYDDIQFIPLAASARFSLDTLFFGADLGYAIGIGDGMDGGFYYRPKIGYNFGPLSLIASYTGVSIAKSTETFMGVEFTTGGGTFSAITLGAEFSF